MIPIGLEGCFQFVLFPFLSPSLPHTHIQSMLKRILIINQVLPHALASLVDAFCDHTILEGHTGLIECLAVSSDNKYLYSGSADQTICQWSLETGELLHTLCGHIHAIFCLVLSPDNKYLYSGSYDENIRQWDVGDEPTESPLTNPTTKKSLRVLYGHTGGVMSLARSSDNRYLFSGSGDTTICQWSIDDMPLNSSTECTAVQTLYGHTRSVTSLVISSDNKYLYSGSSDCTIRQWSISEPRHPAKLLRTVQTYPVTCLAISSDNRFLFSGSKNKMIYQWNIGHESVCGDTLPLIQTLQGHPGVVHSLSVSSNNKFLYSGCFNDIVRRWDITNKKSGARFQGQWTAYPGLWRMTLTDQNLLVAEHQTIHCLPLKIYRDGSK